MDEIAHTKLAGQSYSIWWFDELSHYSCEDDFENRVFQSFCEGFAKLVIYVQLNYFKLDLIIRSHSNSQTQVLFYAFICMLKFSTFVSDDCMQLKGFWTKLLNVSHSYVSVKAAQHSTHTQNIFFHFILVSEMKNAENGVVKLWIESWCEACVYVGNQFLNIELGWLDVRADVYKYDYCTYIPHGWIFQFSYKHKQQNVW